MMPALFAIWRQPLVEKRRTGSLALTWFLLAVCALAALGWSRAAPEGRVLFVMLTAIPLGMLMLLWWSQLYQNARAQCHPAALQLVPVLLPRVVIALVLAWTGLVAVMTLLVGMTVGYPLPVAIVTGLVLLEISFAGTWRSNVVILPLSLAPLFVDGLARWLLACLMTPAGQTVGMLLVLLDGAMALRWLARPRRQRLPRARPAHRPAPDRQPLFLQPLGRSWFSGNGISAGVLALICGALRVSAAIQGQADLHAVLGRSRMWIAMGAVAWLGALCRFEVQRFARARPEQGLLCLTPAAPTRQALNRVLARHLLTGFLRSWLILGMLTLTALAVLGAAWDELVRVAAVWTFSLPLAAVPLRDHARTGRQWTVLAAPLFAVMVAANIFASAGMGTPAQWAALAAVGGVAGPALTLWRWHVMLAAAPALPAGRVQDNHVRAVDAV